VPADSVPVLVPGAFMSLVHDRDGIRHQVPPIVR
jgi:hypothetical protein